ncbi:MAG: CPBP family intramembrane glutamic endopeptidase [Pyrobaculum sp.]|uniref:CPBP family intramembrane metalloprotease n=2 Tax=Pyrobaculum TaxID=2276 RepID=A0A7L4P9J0_9CREN|nr:CPBP family intramembrane glutamic endopeptidase [Pyrobaculum arsenaticum]MCY0889613.1 CPBP family intramembrane metalloprotease [Pyrobaculum arsenaticum]NYR15284.1 CPBP family intramembrane metalloprotease [Pyrobaculum arsenaticum]
MSNKPNGDFQLVDAGVLLALLVVLVWAPRPWGYFFVIASALALRRRILWLSKVPKYVVYALLVYATAFVLDYISVGPQKTDKAWWEVVVLAPLAEEVVFRALPMSRLPPPLGWVFAVFIFGALHPQNPFLASLYGLALALAYLGGGYPASAALHAFNNALWLYLGTSLF